MFDKFIQQKIISLCQKLYLSFLYSKIFLRKFFWSLIMDKNDRPAVYQLINNFKFPITFSRENIEFALDYKPEKDDKFIVSYPKCGTTWTQQIICLIINNGIIQRQSKGEFMINPNLERIGNKVLNGSLKPRVLKTHIPFGLRPYNKFAKYLWVIRNPKDVCVSYYYHAKDKPHFQWLRDFHDYFNIWIKGEIPFGDYFEHVLSYWTHRFDDNFSFLVYEHMKKNPKEAVLKIAEFLGEEFVIKLKENNEFLLNKVLENSTLDVMKTIHFDDVIIRKGIVGDWRNHFTKEESDLVDEKVVKLFSGTGLEKLWVEEMKW